MSRKLRKVAKQQGVEELLQVASQATESQTRALRKTPSKPTDAVSRNSVPAPTPEAEYMPRIRRAKRLVPALPPLTPASQWYKP